MQISFDGLYANHLQKFFFAKLVQPVFLCHRLSKKLKITKIWQLKVVKTKIWFVTGKSGDSGCVPEDSGSSYKSPGLDLKGGLLVFRKSQKISTASDQYVLSYVKNNYRGGWIWPPHPSRIRVNKEEFIYCAERVNAIITPKYLG